MFQTGRADVIEKYLEVFAHLVGRGWSVTAFDWRGQGDRGGCWPIAMSGMAAISQVWLRICGPSGRYGGPRTPQANCRMSFWVIRWAGIWRCGRWSRGRLIRTL
ncbi:hypothetical protein GCM10020258_05200 [Sphingomonas yabuuchiae]